MRQFSIGQKVMFEDKWGRINDGVISELNKPFPTVDDRDWETSKLSHIKIELKRLHIHL